MPQLYTAGGHNMYEAVSALQKCIRRGMEVEAVYWAQEMESNNRWRYLWQRLQVISHEDIGPANPQAAIFTYLMAKQYEEQRVRGKLFTLGLINTVVMLCRSPKSRETDHLLSIVYHQADMKLEVPDFAYDHHTLKGKRQGRGIDFFYDEAAKISPDADSNQYKEQAREIDKNKNTRQWWVETKEQIRSSNKKKYRQQGQGSLFDDSDD